jgi:hypothetical protein
MNARAIEAVPQPGRWSLSRGRENLLALLWCLLLAGLTVLKTAPQASMPTSCSTR